LCRWEVILDGHNGHLKANSKQSGQKTR
jgi:hypothetical protein